ncbi:MAG: sugar ABC transporter permease [Phycisphaerales bacterium]|nr:sugar ABC transporter permease [Phycisphaerales bacterium]
MSGSGRSLQDRRAPYIMLAPFALLFLVFVAWPLIQSVLLATQRTYGPGTARFVGIDNFRELAHDPFFWIALKNTAIFTLGSVCIQLPLSLLLAMALNRPGLKGRAFFRLIFFCPVLVGMVFVAMMFSLLLQRGEGGVLNRMVDDVFNGIGVYHLAAALVSDPWLTSANIINFPWLERWAMLALIVAALWMFVGYNMVYFLAALQNVRKDLIEAATVDGANAYHRFIHVTLPAIRPVASFVVLLSIIGSFQLFELPLFMLGPASYENRGLTIVWYLYQAGFETGDLGYASAIGWVMAMILMFFALVQFVLAKRDEGVLE